MIGFARKPIGRCTVYLSGSPKHKSSWKRLVLQENRDGTVTEVATFDPMISMEAVWRALKALGFQEIKDTHGDFWPSKSASERAMVIKFFEESAIEARKEAADATMAAVANMALKLARMAIESLDAKEAEIADGFAGLEALLSVVLGYNEGPRADEKAIRSLADAMRHAKQAVFGP